MEVERKRRGLVLGGGGARGIYEIGAWIAFQSCGIHFDCVSGTSIGALVGAMYVQDHLRSVIDFVYHLSPNQIVTDMIDPIDTLEDVFENREEIYEFLKSYLKEGMDVTPLRNEIERMFDYEAFSASKVDFGCMTYNVPKHCAMPFFKEDITKENAVDVLMASASCYPAFPVTKIGEDTFVDGGYADNLPMDLALQMGAEQLYVVDVHGIGLVRHVQSDVPITYIEPLLPMGHILDFSQKRGMTTLEMGYLETMKFMSEYCGYMYTFYKECWPKMYMIEKYLKMKFVENDIEVVANLMDEVFGYRVSDLKNEFTKDYFFGKWVECLAWSCHMDAVRIWDYDEFLEELSSRLQHKKGDTLYNFYQILVRNVGQYPLYVEAIRRIQSSEYYLAYVWYFLSLYLKTA